MSVEGENEMSLPLETEDPLDAAAEEETEGVETILSDDHEEGVTSSPAVVDDDFNAGDEGDRIADSPKSPTVKQALKQFDKPDNVALMPDKTISPKQLSFKRSASGNALKEDEESEPGEENPPRQEDETPLHNENEQEEAAQPQGETSALNVSTDSSKQYVPESLSSFVKEAANTLDVTTQEEFWDNSSPLASTARSTGGDNPSAASSTLVTDTSISDRPPTEDSSDRRFKKDLLTKYENKNEKPVPVPDEIQEESVLYADFEATKDSSGENGEAAAKSAKEPEEPTEEEITEKRDVPEEVVTSEKPPLELVEPPEIKQDPAVWMDDGELVDTGMVDTGMLHDNSIGDPSDHSEVSHVGDVDEIQEVPKEIPFDGKTPAKHKEDRAPSPPTTHPMDYSPQRSSPRQSPGGGKTPNIRNTSNGGKKANVPVELGTPLLEPKEPGAGSPSSVSRKSVCSTISSSSRLLQPTASSMGLTGGSNRNIMSDRKKTSEADVSASRDLAKERVKSRKMKEAEQSTQEQQRSPPGSRSIRMSPEEGQARARARVKIRQMQEQEMGKENAQNRRPSATSGGKKQLRPLTVPQGPRLSTATRAQEKRGVRNAASAMGARPDDQSVSSFNSRSLASGSVTSLSMASRAQSYRNNANIRRASGDHSLASASSRSSRRSVTVPKAPKFALDAKYGEKMSSTASRRGLGQKEDDNRSITSRASNSTMSSRRSITVPKAPNFALDAKYGEKGSPTKKQMEYSTVPEPPKTTWHKDRKTVPVAPKFHTTSQRRLPKSQEEKDLEEMNYQFKARPIAAPTDDESARSGSSNARSQTRKVTVPVAPKFHTTSQRKLPKSQEQRDLEEIEKHNVATKAKTRRPSAKKKGTTVPVAPKLSTTSSRRKTTKSKEEKDEEELKKQFKARPMPKSHGRSSTMTKSKSSKKKSSEAAKVAPAPKVAPSAQPTQPNAEAATVTATDNSEP